MIYFIRSVLSFWLMNIGLKIMPDKDLKELIKFLRLRLR